jgi:hypothetical protein
MEKMLESSPNMAFVPSTFTLYKVQAPGYVGKKRIAAHYALSQSSALSKEQQEIKYYVGYRQ